jgi:hypothetical protein
MARQARSVGISRRSWLLAGIATPLFRLRGSDDLAVAFDGDTLRPSAPALHFLTGRALDRLRDAHTVVFISQLTLFQEDHATVFRRAPQRFYVSLDIWDAKFKVTIPGAAPQSKLGLTAAQAESWCLENLAISTLGMPPDRPFWFRFELRTAGEKDLASVVGDSGISISSLIELFSRKPPANEPHWMLETRLRLSDLHRTSSRGAPIG